MLDEWNHERGKIAMKYSENFSSLLFDSSSTRANIYHHYVLKLKNRDFMRLSLHQNAIKTEIHYPIPASTEASNLLAGRFRNAQLLSEYGLSLPISPWQTPEESNYVIDNLKTLTNYAKDSS
jgi:dTDP-4-amino-4,6-dideoxygalactose transaminase